MFNFIIYFSLLLIYYQWQKWDFLNSKTFIWALQMALFALEHIVQGLKINGLLKPKKAIIIIKLNNIKFTDKTLILIAE